MASKCQTVCVCAAVWRRDVCERRQSKMRAVVCVVLLVFGVRVDARPEMGGDDFIASLGLPTDLTPETRQQQGCRDVSQLNNADLLKLLKSGCVDKTQRPIQLCERNRYACVPYHQCDYDHIVSDGRGGFDIRINKQTFDDQGDSLTHSDCIRYGDVCCSRTKQAMNSSEVNVSPVNSPTCGRRNRNGVGARIVERTGRIAQFGECPWMAAVLERRHVNNSVLSYFVCGGSLIHPQVVLTSAHNIHNLPDHGEHAKFVVRLGEHDANRDTELFPHEDVEVAYVVKHPEFHERRLSDDLALLILAEPVVLKQHIQLACLPESNIDYSTARCVTTGWGKDRFGDTASYQAVLKLAEMNAVPHHQCEEQLRATRLGRRFHLDESMICAGGGANDGDACSGDGGSPLVCLAPDSGNVERYVQTGVVSWGIGCGQVGVPGVYAGVARHLDWINAEIDKL